MAWASTVAVVVPSPATSEVLLATSLTICAPMFSRGSLSSISLATVTPSLVIRGAPNFLSRTTLRPLGPRVTFTASARRLTPRRIDCRDSSPYVICFVMGFAPCLLLRTRSWERIPTMNERTCRLEVLPQRDLVEGRVGNLIRLDLRRSLDDRRQELRNLRIRSAAVGIR